MVTVSHSRLAGPDRRNGSTAVTKALAVLPLPACVGAGCHKNANGWQLECHSVTTAAWLRQRPGRSTSKSSVARTMQDGQGPITDPDSVTASIQSRLGDGDERTNYQLEYPFRPEPVSIRSSMMILAQPASDSQLEPRLRPVNARASPEAKVLVAVMIIFRPQQPGARA